MGKSRAGRDPQHPLDTSDFDQNRRSNVKYNTGEPLLGGTEPLAARDHPAAMRASRCRRCGVAPACARVGRRVSQSLVPSLILSRGRARAHSSAPAANSQSAPSSLGGRYRQCLGDSRIEPAGELRLPLHQGLQECRSTDTTKNPPDASAYGISCPPSPRRTRSCGERTGCGTFRAALPHTGPELDLC